MGARATTLVLVVLWVGMSLASTARAERAMVAVAANFAAVVETLQPDFERQTGHSLVLTFGSTGKLYAQIVNGAPFDVLLAADQARPERLERDGVGVAGSRFTYATGRLSLWSSDPALLGGAGPEVLRGTAVRHVAMANPELAPYGLAARQALERLGLWETLAPKIVMGNDVGETYAMAATGNAQAGFVALSVLLGTGGTPSGSRWDVPETLHDPIRQDAILLERAAGNPAAIAFLEYLRTEPARALMVRFGYSAE